MVSNIMLHTKLLWKFNIANPFCLTIVVKFDLVVQPYKYPFELSLSILVSYY